MQQPKLDHFLYLISSHGISGLDTWYQTVPEMETSDITSTLGAEFFMSDIVLNFYKYLISQTSSVYVHFRARGHVHDHAHARVHIHFRVHAIWT
jgi:glutathione peroxidase-family protein